MESHKLYGRKDDSCTEWQIHASGVETETRRKYPLHGEMIPSSTTYTPYAMVQVPDKMARRGSHRPTQSKSKLDTSFYIFAKVLYALYVVLTCIRCIVSQLQARPHRWSSAPELHCSQNEIWRHPVFFLNSWKICIPAAKTTIFIYLYATMAAKSAFWKKNWRRISQNIVDKLNWVRGGTFISQAHLFIQF